MQQYVSTLLKWGVRIVATAGVLYTAAIGLIAVFQDKMVYVPRVPGMATEFIYTPASYHLAYEDVYLTAADGVRIHAWMIWPSDWDAKRRASRPVVLFFQENAGNMQYRLYFIRDMVHYLQCSVLAVSYRGYGPSQGSPSEAGLKLDAAAALEHLATRDDCDSRVVVYGRSLGGAVALSLAASQPHRVRALIIENTFTSLVELVPVVLPILRPVIGPGRPFNFLMRSVWDNRVAAAALTRTPICFQVSLQDEMVPAAQMRALYGYKQEGGPWEVHEYPEAHHMDIFSVSPREYWSSLQRFLHKHVDRADE